MLQIYYGDGKGKTTSGIGQAIRAAGAGMLVTVVQFLKGSPSAELEVLSRIPEITVLRNDMDLGFTYQMSEKEKEQVMMMHNVNLLTAIDMINQKKCELLILDELLSTYELGLIDRNMVHTLMEMRPKELEIVITGHSPIPYFMDQADYITNMKKERHPFDKGVPARFGIEY